MTKKTFYLVLTCIFMLFFLSLPSAFAKKGGKGKPEHAGKQNYNETGMQSEAYGQEMEGEYGKGKGHGRNGNGMASESEREMEQDRERYQEKERKHIEDGNNAGEKAGKYKEKIQKKVTAVPMK